jgi:hypothetical protein
MTFDEWWDSLESKPENPQLRLLLELSWTCGHEQGVEDQKWKRKPTKKKKTEAHHA